MTDAAPGDVAPMRVHQLWWNFRDAADPSANTMPAAERRDQQTIVAMCAAHGWEYTFWTGADTARGLVAELVRRVHAGEAPWPHAVPAADVLACYDALPVQTQKHDFVRWVLLFLHGGLYVDLDVAWLGGAPPAWAFRAAKDAMLLFEPQGKSPYCISNCYLYARAPAMPAIGHFICEMVRHVRLFDAHGELQTHLVHVTGPIGVYSIWKALWRSEAPADLALFDSIQTVEHPETALFFDAQAPGAFMTHKWRNLWSGARNNLFPERVVPQFFF